MEVGCLGSFLLDNKYNVLTAILVICFVGPGLEQTIAAQDNLRIVSGLRPKISTAYLSTFKLFLAFVVFMKLDPPYSLDTIVLYLEYITQNYLKICSLRNHVTVLKH